MAGGVGAGACVMVGRVVSREEEEEEEEGEGEEVHRT